MNATASHASNAPSTVAAGIYASVPPAAPAGDTVVTLYGDRWASFGPRVDRQMTDGLISMPCAPSEADSWSVFVFNPQARWEWIADAVDRATARMIAAAHLLDIQPSHMRGE